MIAETEIPTPPPLPECPGCAERSDPRTWAPLEWDGETKNYCPKCHADQAQLRREQDGQPR